MEDGFCGIKKARKLRKTLLRVLQKPGMKSLLRHMNVSKNKHF